MDRMDNMTSDEFHTMSSITPLMENCRPFISKINLQIDNGENCKLRSSQLHLLSSTSSSEISEIH